MLRFPFVLSRHIEKTIVSPHLRFESTHLPTSLFNSRFRFSPDTRTSKSATVVSSSSPGISIEFHAQSHHTTALYRTRVHLSQLHPRSSFVSRYINFDFAPAIDKSLAALCLAEPNDACIVSRGEVQSNAPRECNTLTHTPIPFHFPLLSNRSMSLPLSFVRPRFTPPLHLSRSSLPHPPSSLLTGRDASRISSLSGSVAILFSVLSSLCPLDDLFSAAAAAAASLPRLQLVQTHLHK